MRKQLEKIKDGFVKYDENYGISPDEAEWLIETIENQQAEIDTLSMAHDNMHRKLSTYKESLPKDKHTLIKTIHSLNNKVKNLENIKNAKIALVNKGDEEKRYVQQEQMIKLEQQNKRYREAIEETLQAMGVVDKQKYEKILEGVLEGGSDER